MSNIVIQKATIIGQVVFQKSLSSDCICCEGQHIFSRQVILDPLLFKFHNHRIHDEKDFIRSFLRNSDCENKKVRLTIEIVEDDNIDL